MTDDEETAAQYLSGNKEIPGAKYAAHCYCGHQFGHFSGQLGDGATMYDHCVLWCSNFELETVNFFY